MNNISRSPGSKRYMLFHAFVGVIIASLFAIEELVDGDAETHIGILLEFLLEVPLFFLTSFIIGYLASIIIRWLDKRFPWDSRSFERLVYEIGIVIFLIAILSIMTSIVEAQLDSDDIDLDRSKFQVITTFLFFINISMVFAFYEYTSLNEDKNVIVEVAKDLEKQNYISKYEALRNQVNPHFLFNSLNVLSSLIYSDIELSDKFIKKFSEVFRYVLELNNEELVTLKKEIDFINSYFFLQKIRHEDAVSIAIKIKAEDLEASIPPMALQIVIENAFKHNIVTKASPLHIEIYCKQERLIISNNYQARRDFVSSTGIGQKNLMDRYKMLSDKLPEFYIEDGNYIAELPILKQIANS